MITNMIPNGLLKISIIFSYALNRYSYSKMVPTVTIEFEFHQNESVLMKLDL